MEQPYVHYAWLDFTLSPWLPRDVITAITQSLQDIGSHVPTIDPLHFKLCLAIDIEALLNTVLWMLPLLSDQTNPEIFRLCIDDEAVVMYTDGTLVSNKKALN